jgi:hypothetical protein
MLILGQVQVRKGISGGGNFEEPHDLRKNRAESAPPETSHSGHRLFGKKLYDPSHFLIPEFQQEHKDCPQDQRHPKRDAM